jgi:hypothetical protein
MMRIPFPLLGPGLLDDPALWQQRIGVPGLVQRPTLGGRPVLRLNSQRNASAQIPAPQRPPSGFSMGVSAIRNVTPRAPLSPAAGLFQRPKT